MVSAPEIFSDTPRDLLVRIAVLEERVQGRDYALKLQATEYERRLTDLNHAHALAAEKVHDFLQNTIYDRDKREFESWKANVDKQLAMASGSRAAYIAMASTALSSLALGLTLLQLFK